VRQREDEIAYHLGVRRRQVSEPGDADPVQHQIERRRADGRPHQALLLLVVKLHVDKELGVLQQQHAEGRRRNHRHRFQIVPVGEEQDDFRREPDEPGQQDGEHQGDPHGDPAVFLLPPSLQLPIKPGDIGPVDGVDNEVEHDSQRIHHPIEGGLVLALQVTDHDSVAVRKDGLRQMIRQQRDVEAQGVFPVFPGKELLSFSCIDEEQSSADTDVRQRLPQDPGESLLLRVRHQNVADDDHRHHLQHGDGDHAQILVLELLLTDPKQDGRVEKDIQHQHHDEGRRQLQKPVQIPAKGKIQGQEQHAKAHAYPLHGGDVSVPIPFEPDHGR